MASLTGTKIKDTYDGLLKTTDNAGIGATAKQLTDGLGTGSPIYVSTSKVGIGGSPTNALDVIGEGTVGNGTYGVKFSYSAGNTSGVIDTADSANTIELRTSGTQQLLINNAGNAFFTKGIFLNGETASANQLNDYEEGTFTPEVADASTGGNVAAGGSFYGFYTKIGRQVTIPIQATNIDTTGMTAGNVVIIRNLPFNVANLSGTPYFCGAVDINDLNVGTTFTSVTAIALDNTNRCQIQKQRFDGGNSEGMIVSDLDSGVSDIRFSLTYFV